MSSIRLPWPDWEIVRRIGAGGFGTVYEIVRRDGSGHEEHAALKVVSIPNEQGAINSLRMDGYDDDSITARYREYAEKLNKEYDFLKELKGHSNIVNVYDNSMALHEDGLGWDIFIRMELLHPMQEILGKKKSFPEEEVIRFGKDMCEALDVCHARNIIHRDIKPDNIFRSDSGDWKLGDFGIARTMEHTTTATKAGTPDYEAPEVYHGERYGKEVDIYSLGLVLYWLLNNRRRPFLPLNQPPTAAEEKEARSKRFGGHPLPAPLNGSPGLKQIVLKACSYNPKDRYASAEDMYRDLLAVESGAYQVHSSAPAWQGGMQSSFDILQSAHGDSGRGGGYRNGSYGNGSDASDGNGTAPAYGYGSDASIGSRSASERRSASGEGSSMGNGWEKGDSGTIGNPRSSARGGNKNDLLGNIDKTERSVEIEDKPRDTGKEEPVKEEYRGPCPIGRLLGGEGILLLMYLLSCAIDPREWSLFSISGWLDVLLLFLTLGGPIVILLFWNLNRFLSAIGGWITFFNCYMNIGVLGMVITNKLLNIYYNDELVVLFWMVIAIPLAFLMGIRVLPEDLDKPIEH